MFARTFRILHGEANCGGVPVPLAWLDSFSMRSFTNDAVFDDTLPVADGLLEAGYRVPLPELAAAMDAWFRRKGWLRDGDLLRIEERSTAGTHPTS